MAPWRASHLLTNVFLLYFCNDAHGTGVYEIHPETVIAGLTRNLLNERDTSSRSGDGGCPSAMTVKGKDSATRSIVPRKKVE